MTLQAYCTDGQHEKLNRANQLGCDTALRDLFQAELALFSFFLPNFEIRIYASEKLPCFFKAIFTKIHYSFTIFLLIPYALQITCFELHEISPFLPQ